MWNTTKSGIEKEMSFNVREYTQYTLFTTAQTTQRLRYCGTQSAFLNSIWFSKYDHTLLGLMRLWGILFLYSTRDEICGWLLYRSRKRVRSQRLFQLVTRWAGNFKGITEVSTIVSFQQLLNKTAIQALNCYAHTHTYRTNVRGTSTIHTLGTFSDSQLLLDLDCHM